MASITLPRTVPIILYIDHGLRNWSVEHENLHI